MFSRGALSRQLLVPFVLLFASIFCFGQEEDPLSRLGVKATKGAAAGYVPDETCRICHQSLYDSYQHVGMAKSFADPKNAKVIERFGETFFHKTSQRYYRIDKEGDELYFNRWQLDGDGKPINRFRVKIDWVMGSGNRARSYLYHTEWGELYMLPLGWYSEDQKWEMSPGFEDKNHFGVMRKVPRTCMFCHNAFAEVPENTDDHWLPHRFPKDLPMGTGCQRCHGPGAEHIRTAMSAGSVDAIRSKIVNPRKLSWQRRDEVCFQCHMLPSVTITGVRRFEREDYSFRPGQKLSDYLVHVEVEGEKDLADVFEINHHGYRFYQSECFKKSEGAIACISCHNPHVKPESKAFRAKVSGVCMDCHAEVKTAHTPKLESKQDCVTCHMPTRRTEDVIQVTMTDHRIAKGPFDHKKLVAPVQRREPFVNEVSLLPLGDPPKGQEGEIYRTVSALRAFQMEPAANALKNLLIKNRYDSLTPYIDLFLAQLKLQQYEQAEETTRFLMRSFSNKPTVLTGLGNALVGQGKYKEAIGYLEKSIEQQARPDTYHNLALAHYGLRDYEKCLENVGKALSMRPTSYGTYVVKARALRDLKRLSEARDALLIALSIKPERAVQYQLLVEILRQLGENEEAERYLEAGLRLADAPGLLEPLKRAKD